METKEILKQMRRGIKEYDELMQGFPEDLEHTISLTIATAAHDLGLILQNIERKLDEHHRTSSKYTPTQTLDEGCRN